VGRSYDAVIRVNSQSGKGGMAYLLEQDYGLELPRRLQIEFSRAVQKVADQTGLEITSEGIYQIFEREYLTQATPYAYVSHKMVEDSSSDEPVQIDIGLLHNKASMSLQGGGNGPIDAFVDALGLDVTLMDYHEHAIGHGANAKAACYVELRLDGGPTLFGAGIDSNIVTASFKAVLSAINRQIALKAETPASIAQAAA
jgi:2-isopropylmalate synthase